MEEMHNELNNTRGELDKVTTDDDNLRERTDRLSDRLGHFLERLREREHEIEDSIIEEMLELENALAERYPGTAASIRRAIDIMSNAGL